MQFWLIYIHARFSLDKDILDHLCVFLEIYLDVFPYHVFKGAYRNESLIVGVLFNSFYDWDLPMIV